MMRILWVTMGMYVPFVAPSLTLMSMCVTSVSSNVVHVWKGCVWGLFGGNLVYK